MRPIKPLAGGLVAKTPTFGAKPALSWVRVSDLRIDDRYQRPVTARGEATIRSIASAFNWSKFSPLIVAADASTFVIIDGQHRAIAAASLGIDSVPCSVIEAGPKDAAAIFAAINGTVTPMTAQAVFKAARAAGSDWALAIDRACGAAGVEALVYPLMASRQKPLQTNAIGALRRVLDRHGEPTLRATLQCLAAAMDASHQGFLTSKLIAAYGGIFASHPGWVRDPVRVKRRFAATVVSLVSPSAFEAELVRVAGAGRKDSDDWSEIKRRVQALHARKFSSSMIASSLRLPYRDVDLALKELAEPTP